MPGIILAGKTQGLRSLWKAYTNRAEICMETFVQSSAGCGNCTARGCTQCQRNGYGTRTLTGQKDALLCLSPNLYYCTHIKAGLENWGYSLHAKKQAYLWLFSPTTAVKISPRKLSAFTGVLHMQLTGSIATTLLLFSLFHCVKAFVMTGRFGFL